MRDCSRASRCRSAGPGAKPYIPLFAGFFLFILFCNWSGLIPFIGKIDGSGRPPATSTSRSASRSSPSSSSSTRASSTWASGYLAKFFPFGEFRKGVGAGIIAVFVGLIELLLEFVKPVTLSMRLFGNIYGGEVALGVLTALTIAIIPMAMIALELMLNLVQALIFATLTLMFTLAAMEHHGDEHHEAAEPHASPRIPRCDSRRPTDHQPRDQNPAEPPGQRREHGPWSTSAQASRPSA